MKRAFLAAGPLAAMLALSGCVAGDFGLRVHDSVEESRPLAAGGEFSLQNTNGTVTITAWDEPRVLVEATKAASSERALKELEVVVEGEDNRVTVKTVYPRPRWLGGAGKVDYRVSVPRSARVTVKNVNGKVEVDGVDGRLHASTVNGSLEVGHGGGEVEASTTNGSVRVGLDRVDPAGRNELSATNGSVRLTLPRDAGADLSAHTVNGSVNCEFDLTERERSSRRRLEGRIGGGGARFELRTVNGSVHVEQGLGAAHAASPAEAAPGGPGH
jgi:DUF4097 and DUF4098 domain-containing protein YvlB